MVRQGRRLHVPHATYYVVNRFCPDLEVLVSASPHALDPEQVRRVKTFRRRFERLLGYACVRWGARVHAYSWLPDSALLLIEISQAPLEHVLRSLRAPLSRYLRKRVQGVGSPFAGRYYALLIDPAELYLDFLRHIFWSPVNAGVAENPLAYEHSSARACIGEPSPAFLYPTAAADALGSAGYGSRTGFTRFLSSRPTSSFAGLLAHGSRLDHRIAGGAGFVEQMHRLSRIKTTPPAPDAVLSWVSHRLRIPVDAIVGQSRHRIAVEARALVGWLATCAGPAPLADIARCLSCGPSSLHRAIRYYAWIRPALFNYETFQEFERTVMGTDARGPDAPGPGTEDRT